MDPNKSFNLVQYFPFLAVFGLVASFWQQTKNIVTKIFRIFWKQKEVPYDFIYTFYEQLRKESIVWDFDDYDIFKSESFYFSLKHNTWIPALFKRTRFELFLYKKFIPIFISGIQGGKIKVQYLKFSFNFEKFFDNTCKSVYDDISKEAIRKEKQSRFYVEEKRGTSLKDIGGRFEKPSYSGGGAAYSNDKGPEKHYILEPYYMVNNKIPKSIGIDVNDIMAYVSSSSEKNKYQLTKTGEYVCSQVQRWLDARQWYEERNINWRRGMLLNGKPGNGKSSLILEVAKRVGIPLYIFDLSSMDNSEFNKALGELVNGSAIILFEDFDNVFDGRKNITKTQQFGGLNFDYFINKLSGVNSIQNKFVFITTNHIEKIDPAILRPGRIDEKIELQPLDKDEKIRMAQIILSDNNLIDKAIENSDNLTTAEFENKCVQIALENFWRKN